MNTPYQWTKQVASHWGGTRNGAIVHWPKGIKGKGEIRSQFHHVIDVAPTILEAAGLPEPASVNGIQQDPIEGVSMLYSFNDAKAAEQHETQYFEMFGNRGIYHKGWTAVTKHRTPWASFETKVPAFDDDVWELYDTTTDWSQAKDLSKQLPEKLHELQRLWLIEATRYKVLPLDDRMVERMNPDTAGRPVLIKGKTQILFGGMGRLLENCVLNLKNKSHSVTAEIVVPEKGAEGVIVSQGANIGGWSLYAKDREAEVLLQLGRLQALLRRGQHSNPGGRSSGAHGVRVRRRRSGQGRQGNAVRRRQEGWRGRDWGHAGDGLFRRRRLRRGRGQRRTRLPGLRRAGQRLQRTRQGRAAGHRRGRRESRSPDLAGGGRPSRDGETVGLVLDPSAEAYQEEHGRS
jgi:arylsulfatase